MARKVGRDWHIEQRAVDHYVANGVWPVESAPLLELEAALEDRTLQSALDAAENAALKARAADERIRVLEGEIRVLQVELEASRRQTLRVLEQAELAAEAAERQARLAREAVRDDVQLRRSLSPFPGSSGD